MYVLFNHFQKYLQDTKQNENKAATSTESATESKPTGREAPTQMAVKKEIEVLNSKIAAARAMNNSGLGNISQKDLQDLITKKEEKEKELKRLQKKCDWEKNKRLRVKETLKSLSQANEENANALKFMNRGIQGRPRIETDQPQLFSTILFVI